MYIRRKVFSVAYDEVTGEEKLFSTTEILSEDAYMEKLYAEVEEEEKKNRIKGSAIGTGAATAIVGTGAAGAYGIDRAGQYLRRKRVEANLGKYNDAKSVVDSLKKDTKLIELPIGRENLKKAEERLKNIDYKKAGSIEKKLLKAGKFLRKNKKIAGGVALGTVATGAATGAAIGKKE